MAFWVGEIITRQDWISSVQSKINVCAISFLLTVENIKPHIIIYYKILDFDNIVKFKTAVFPYKNLRKKGIPAIFSDFITPAVELYTLIKLDMLPKEICREQTFAYLRYDSGQLENLDSLMATVHILSRFSIDEYLNNIYNIT